MANSFTQLYIHFVFAVGRRESTITESWRDELYKYITGAINNRGHHLMAIGGMPDHVHLLVSMSPKESVASLVQSLKSQSSRWINEQRFFNCHFEWQTGYGAFSYTKSHTSQVINYIKNQKEHHRLKTFLEEYKHILDEMGFTYDEKFVFHKI